MTNERPSDNKIAPGCSIVPTQRNLARTDKWEDRALIGKRLPNLNTILTAPKTQWQTVTVNGWYGGGERVVEVVTGTAVWYHTGMPPVPMQWERSARRSRASSMILLFYAPIRRLQRVQILQWFVRRWLLEVTFQEVRAHLGVETQRQWSDERNRSDYKAPSFGCSHALTLVAHHLQGSQNFSLRRAAWYAIALADRASMRWHSCANLYGLVLFPCQLSQPRSVKIPRALLERLTDALVYAA